MTALDAIAEEARNSRVLLERRLSALIDAANLALVRVRLDGAPSLHLVSLRLSAAAEAWEMCQAWRQAARAAGEGGGARR